MFSTSGKYREYIRGGGDILSTLIKNLAIKLAEKENKQYLDVITSLGTKLSFCILKAGLLCVRESRISYGEKNIKQEETDFALFDKEAHILNFLF